MDKFTKANFYDHGSTKVFNDLEMYLCPEIRNIVKKISADFKEKKLEEIRLRINQPLMVIGNNKDYFVNKDGSLTLSPYGAFIVSKQNIDNTLQFASNYSIYSVEEELKNGYITIVGGHRIGIVGKVLANRDTIKTIKDYSGLNIRISREIVGVSLPLLPYLIDNKDCFLNTLLVSPPQCGKTTLLRDIVKNISTGIPSMGFRGMKVGVVDERSEIGACYRGVPQNDLGPRTDILDACPKAEGMMMLIRAMSPQVIATDEVGRKEDGAAIQEALMAGIKLITTVHGSSLEDIMHKKIIGDLIKYGVFERLVFLSNRKGVGTIESIIDGKNLKILYSPHTNDRSVMG